MCLAQGHNAVMLVRLEPAIESSSLALSNCATLITTVMITKAIGRIGFSKVDGEMQKTAGEAGAAEVGDLIKTRPLVKSL